MYQWLRNNNKRLLAFFGVFLMIAFLLPTTFQGCQNTQGVVGQFNDGSRIYAQEMQNAQNEWVFLARSVLVPTNRPPPEDYVPFLRQMMVGMAGAAEIEKNDLMYHLLREEARRLGVVPRQQVVDAYLEVLRFQMPAPDNRLVDFETIRNSRMGVAARQAVQNLLAVQLTYERAVSAVKVTQPETRTFMAMQGQLLSLNLVPFYVADFEAAIAEPTAEVLKSHFDKYADTLAGQPTKENTFGFGYKVPDRVKLQYIHVSADAVRDAVTGDTRYGSTQEERTHYWKKEGFKYFIAHQDEFPADATTRPSETPSTNPAIASPGVDDLQKRFDAVQTEAIESAMGPEIESTTRKVQSRITGALSADYVAWSTAKASNAAPLASALGAYDSVDYLMALAKDVEANYRVKVEVVSLHDELRSAEELAQLQGVAELYSAVRGTELPFVQYVFAASSEFVPPENQDEPAVLSLYEPSQVLVDLKGGFAQFRVTAAEKSHRPASMDEVAAAVKHDVRRSLAMDAAAAEAQKLMDAAKTAGSLEAAATASGKLTVALPEVRVGQIVDNVNLPELTQHGGGQLDRVVFDLLAAPADAPARAVARIASAIERTSDPAATQPTTRPAQPKQRSFAAAIEVTGTKGTIPPEMQELAEMQIAMNRMQGIQRPFAEAWFQYDNVAKRTGLKAAGVR